MVTVDDVLAVARPLPRSYQVVVHGRLKFRVGQIVYLAFSRDESVLGFAFPKEWRPVLVEAEPHKFMLPDPSDMRFNWIHARLAALDHGEMRDLVLEAWRMVVPKRVAADYDSSLIDEYTQQVLALVKQIPSGRVMSYGSIAEYLFARSGRSSPRQVGHIMSHYGAGVPWHRVVTSTGRVVASHATEARARLAAEGTPLRNGVVDMERAAWTPSLKSNSVVGRDAPVHQTPDDVVLLPRRRTRR